MNYKQAYDKIIDAYFKDEIKPYNGRFCFCGTLAGFLDADERPSCRPTYSGWYTDEYRAVDLQEMESALLVTIYNEVGGNNNIYDPFISDNSDRGMVIKHPNYETALFNGMCAALDVLKSIHKDRGENVDELPALTKRVLCTK